MRGLDDVKIVLWRSATLGMMGSKWGLALTCAQELEGAQNAGNACGLLAHCHARPLEHLSGIVQHRRLPSDLQQATAVPSAVVAECSLEFYLPGNRFTY